MQILLQILLFLLIFISYFFVLKFFSSFPFFVIGFLFSVFDRIRGRQATPEFFGAITRAEVIWTLLLPPVFLFCLFWFRLWESSWIYLWENPLLITILYISSTWQASGSGGYNPIFRNLASGALFATGPIFILILVGFFAPASIWPNTFQWAVTLAAVFLLLVVVVVRFQAATDIQTFEALDKRHDTIGESLKKMQHLSYVIGDMESWRAVREAVDNVEELYSGTLQALRNKRLQEADSLMIRAEAEVSHVERTFRDRILLSLRDELKARLEQARVDVGGLQTEFEVAGLRAGNLTQLAQQIAELNVALDGLDLTDEGLLERLAPFEKLFREIVDTRTALRFRQQVDAAGLRDEVEGRWLLVEIGKRLNLDTGDAEARRKDAETALQKFLGDPVKTSGELVEAYQSVQKALSAFRASLAFLESQIGHGWNVQTVESERLSVYVPKACSTNKAVQGAVGVEFDGRREQEVSLSIDGILLELEADRTLKVSPMPGHSYGANLFTFVGKRGGAGLLKLRLADPQQSQFAFRVQVKPSAIEIARDAAVFATPVGAVAVPLLHYFAKYEWKDAIPIGAAIGAGFGLLLFFVNYLRHRRSGPAGG